MPRHAAAVDVIFAAFAYFLSIATPFSPRPCHELMPCFMLTCHERRCCRAERSTHTLMPLVDTMLPATLCHAAADCYTANMATTNDVVDGYFWRRDSFR